jgi:hypothetical protein
MAMSKPDADKDSASKEAREKASKYAEDIDNKYMSKFRALLKQYIETLPTDPSEIAVGLNLSRPLVTDFLAENRNDLPLSIGSICHLHKTLTDIERAKSKRISNKKSDPESDKSPSIAKLRAEAIDRRLELADKGADELLIAAGFQPRNMKMVPVYPQLYSQLSFLSYLYKDRPLSQDLFFQITEQELDRKELLLMHEQAQDSTKNEVKRGIIYKQEEKEEEKPDIPLKELKSNIWMNTNDKHAIEDKYRRAIDKINNKDGLTSYEKAGLLTSVLNNQLNKDEEVDFKLRVIRVERIPLSLTWENWKAKEFDALWNKIDKLSSECENQFLGLQKDAGENHPNHQVTRNIVTCLCDGDRNKINFEFISTGTHSRTAISAIFISLGLSNFMPTIKFDIRSFKEDVSSLIKALLIIKPNYDLPSPRKTSREESYLGEWVSDDLIQSIVQATVIASKKLVKQKIGDNSDAVALYKDLVKKMAKIRKQFYKYKTAFDGYDFNDGIISTQKFISIEKDIEGCIEQIESIKKKYPDSLAVGIWNNFLSNLCRLKIGSKIYRLIHENIKFNYASSSELIERIERELLEIEKNQIDFNKLVIPAKISLIAEKIAHNLAFGVSMSYGELPEETVDLLEVNNILGVISKIDKKIAEYLEYFVTQNRPYNDPGYDIHYSLGSYYSITGRLLLYRASKIDDINSACDRLLKAIYYFYRIGLARKIERNLTLVGRVKVRSKKDDYIQQCKELSEIVLNDNISKVNAPSNQNFNLSMRSRLNSLSAEYSFVIEENRLAALEYALQALRGALWLGLNRHTADNLYTIARCAKGLEGIRIKEYLHQHFPSLYGTDRSYEMFIHSPQQNSIAIKVVSMLFSISDVADRPQNNCWSDVWENFRDASAEIWNTWYKDARNATKDEKVKHPFAIQIEDMKFLEPIDRITHP